MHGATATALWTSADVIRITKGKSATDQSWVATGISIDTRTLVPGDIFFAFPGENVNGAMFVPLAFDKGAAAVVLNDDVNISQWESLPIMNIVQLPDVGRALEDLGKYVGKMSTVKRIAITGSVGKTGTKEALTEVLSAQSQAYGNFGNFNNRIGVPLSLARLPHWVEYGVFEVGMSSPGEISQLSHMIRPTVAIVTNISFPHLAAFSSVADIADEKCDIFDGLLPGGIGILNRDDFYFQQLHNRAISKGVTNILTFGEHESADFRLLDFTLSENESVVNVLAFKTRKLNYKVAHPGKHWIWNSLGVLAVVGAIGGNLDDACATLGGLKQIKGRGARKMLNLECGLVTIIDESYNASPVSVRATLDVLSGAVGHGSLKSKRRIAVLGDMKELGELEERLHLELIPCIKSAVDLMFACGELMGKVYEQLPKEIKGGKGKSALEILPFLLDQIHGGDIILLKGSRVNRLELIIEELEKKSTELVLIP